MDIYTVSNEVLQILNNIDSLQEELKILKDSRERDYESEESIERQIDAYEDTLESLEWDLKDLVEEIVKDIKNTQCEKDAFSSQKSIFAAKERWAAERIDRENELLKWILKSNGEKKVKGDLFTVSIQKNGGLRGIEYCCSPDNLPEQYRITKTEYLPNQFEIRKALDAGVETNLFRYKPQGEHISIR